MIKKIKPEFYILGILILLLLLTRIPFMTNWLSIDNVNLAFALEKFDPLHHQPQPPGYLFFVLFARLVNLVFHDAWQTFRVISLLMGAITVWVSFLLGKRMFSFWAGVIGALLLLVNPVFWQANIEGPLRPALALFAVITAYCCWRCWNGEKQFATWGAVALGIGSGFRPDLIAFLLPLLLVSVWMGTRSKLAIYSACIILSGAIALWAIPTIIATGGFPAFWDQMTDYSTSWIQSSSSLPGSGILGWLRAKNRLFIWNGISIFGWIWAAPFYFATKNKSALGCTRPIFLALWVLPGIALQAVTHFDAPGHTLFTTAAWCLMGANLLSAVHLGMAYERYAMSAIVIALNAMMFFNLLGLPNVTEKNGLSLKNAIQVAIHECSVGNVQYYENVTSATLAEINKYSHTDRPSVIVTMDEPLNKKWFMNWRIGRYYRPNCKFWVLYETKGSMRAELVMRNKKLESIPPQIPPEIPPKLPIQIPISGKARILWLLEPGSSYPAEIAKSAPLNGGNSVYYTDITPESKPILLKDANQSDKFEIVPVK
jgi:hypothetical protein